MCLSSLINLASGILNPYFRIGERKFDFRFQEQDIHPNIRQIRTNAHFSNSWKYLEKDTTEGLQRFTRGALGDTDITKRKNQDLLDLREWVLSCSTWREVMMDMDHQYLISRHLKVVQEWWQTRIPRNISMDIELKEWQRTLLQSLSEGIITS